MKRITGTHLYTYTKCPRAVELDLHGDRAARRPLRDDEEFVLQRGRDHEAAIVTRLGWPEPAYPPRDWEAGAAATAALLREGVPGVQQGVLLGTERLGIPDLLRREAGASALGDHHYVIGDIKSSQRPRGDQILQIAFYSRLLAELQERDPEYAYLILKDGREERFRLADYEPVIVDAERRVLALARREEQARPFLSRACESCRWSLVCAAELERADDLSLLDGMTRGLRETLERLEVGNCAAVAAAGVDSLTRRSHLEAALLRRLHRAARARREGHALREASSGDALDPERVAVLQLLRDPFAERVHWLGVRFPATEAGVVREARPASADAELPAFQELVAALPGDAKLLHWGTELPRWYEDAAWRARASIELEARMVDLARRVLGSTVFPGPTFHVADVLARGLGVDPYRHGRSGAAAMWAATPEGGAWLREKGRGDLDDLAALLRWYLAEPEGGWS